MELNEILYVSLCALSLLLDSVGMNKENQLIDIHVQYVKEMSTQVFTSRKQIHIFS